MAAEELTLNEVAEELDVHYMTAYRYVRLGQLPARKKGGTWRVLKSDLDALRKEPPTSGRRGRPSSPWDERLLQRLLAADQAGAWKVVEAARLSGMSPQTIYLEMVVPAMRRVGEEWHEGNISVAEEHAAMECH